MMSKSGCIECGTPIYFDDFEPVTSCPNCSTAFRLPRDSSGSFILTYSYNVGAGDARSRAMSIIMSRFCPNRFRSRFDVTEVFPVYLPLWGINARLSGWTGSASGETAAILPVNMTKKFRLPAYENVEYIGEPSEVNGSEAVISPERHFPSLSLAIRPEDVRERAEQVMRSELSALHPDYMDSGKLNLSIIFQTIIMYPAWIVRFRTGRGEHALTIDGITGELMNEPDVQKMNEGLMHETAIALACSGVAAAGAMLFTGTTFHGLGFGLMTSGIALFALINSLRYLLRAPHHGRHGNTRRVTV
jgi:hypothetical protein